MNQKFKLYKNRIYFLSVLLLCSTTWAQTESDATTGMAFLKVGVDARAAGMGEAFTAVSNNAYATYWNPAGLLQADQTNAGFMHNEWLLDVQSEFGAIQFRREQSSWGLHVYSMNVAGLQVRSAPTIDPLEETSAHYLSMGLSYARSISDNIDAGLTLKYLFEKIFVYGAKGYAADLGITHRGLADNLVVAATLQNLGSMGELNLESTALPMLFRTGAAYTLPQKVGPLDLLIAADAVIPLEENIRIHTGLEATAWEQLAVRLGYVSGYESRSVSFGVGVRKSILHFDYSYSPFDDDLGQGQRFSILLLL